MEKRQFGTTDLRASVLGLGCAALGSRTGRRVAMEAVSRAAALGVNFYDTAPFYGQGESERILGAVVCNRRHEFIVATKVGLYPSLLLRTAAVLKPMVRSALKAIPGARRQFLQQSVQGFMRSNNTVSFDAASIAKSVDSSLRRLRTDYIDLLLLHVTPPAGQIDTALEVMLRLKQQGKIRHFGASSHGAEETALWLSLSGRGVAALQVMLNPLEIQALNQCLPAAQASGTAIIAREPFARGKLLPPRQPESSALGFLGQGFDNRFSAMAARLQRTVPQLAVQFLAEQPGVAVVLAGMSTIAHLEENIRALSLPALSPQDLQEVRRLGSTA
jgi:aryl-alcohol dehydrogenase-like predicted oxidoreductase